VDDDRRSWSIVPDMLVAIEKEVNSSARRVTMRWRLWLACQPQQYGKSAQ
jgi:hypothetical protein